MRPTLQACLGLLLAVGITSGAVLGAAAEPDSDPPIVVTVPEAVPAGTSIQNAQLRWGLSREATSGAFAGGCNFLSAGAAGNSGSARAWTAADGLYSAQSGAVRILRPLADGSWVPSSFASKCQDANGSTVTVASLTSATNAQVVIDGGTGSLEPGIGGSIRWTGSFTAAFYGGMTYWSASNPVLTLDGNGNGRLTATASGYGTSMEDMTIWEPIAGRTVVLAELRGVALGTAAGFAITPEYLGVSVPGAGQNARTSGNAAYWGSFPSSFVAFHKLTGQTGYWLSTGGQRDAAKPATVLTVNYDAENPAFVPHVGADGSTSSVPSNPLRLRPDTAETTTGSPATAGTTTTFSKPAPGGLVPPAVGAALSPLMLPLGGTLLAVLVGTLSWLGATGRLILPWSRS